MLCGKTGAPSEGLLVKEMILLIPEPVHRSACAGGWNGPVRPCPDNESASRNIKQ